MYLHTTSFCRTRHGGIKSSLGDSTQRVLDAGQKRFGAEMCEQCNLFYDPADPDDSKLHDQYHHKINSALSYPVS